MIAAINQMKKMDSKEILHKKTWHWLTIENKFIRESRGLDILILDMARL